jgi:hypothetical protein
VSGRPSDWAGGRRVRVREVDDDDEGRRLVRIVRRGSGSVVTWRRAQMVLLSAQGMDVAAITKVAFTSEDRVLLREEGVSFQRLKTWKASTDPRDRQPQWAGTRLARTHAALPPHGSPAPGPAL